MFSKVTKYFNPYFTVGEPILQVGDPPAHYVYGYYTTLAAREALGYALYQKGVIQGCLDHKCPAREALNLYPRVVFQAALH